MFQKKYFAFKKLSDERQIRIKHKYKCFYNDFNKQI